MPQTIQRAGFTLLEILVVLTLMAILTSMVIVNFTGADQRQLHEGEVERLALRLDLARQRAVQRNREVGFNLSLNEYEFVELDRQANAWRLLDERPLRPGAMDPEILLTLSVEGLTESESESEADEAGELADGLTREPPDLVFFRSGEVTPFELTYALGDASRSWTISSDGLSSVRMQGIDE